ncbi:MAG: N,N-dimethylformamidase [Planctomycetes bacterium]|nr:N,N-dimethylformamidase [Planctomycetota bacterium]
MTTSERRRILAEGAARVAVVGYTDRITAVPGERIRVMVSCRQPTFRADLVRLVHGGRSPDRDGFAERVIASTFAGDHPGREQALRHGSYARVEDDGRLHPTGSFTIHAWIQPTRLTGTQSILAHWNDDRSSGYALVVEDGALTLWIGAGGRRECFAIARRLTERAWYSVTASVDAASSTVRLHQQRLGKQTLEPASSITEARCTIVPAAADSPLLIAAYARDAGAVAGHFNGKIDSPSLFAAAATITDAAEFADGRVPAALAGATIAAWDPSLDIGTTRVRDTGPHRLDAVTVNLPKRAVTGRSWSGRETDFRRAPDQYRAIHFHDDDLDDAGWEPSFAFDVPAVASGIYAIRLQAGASVDHLPFIVRPAPGAAKARIAFLAPTLTYQAYSSEHLWLNLPDQTAPLSELQDQDLYAAHHRLHSLYERHGDGSGVCYASLLRPLCTFRPGFRIAWARSVCHLGLDLSLLAWMDAQGFAYDVISDHDLHNEGLAVLRDYPVVVTGSHPEYTTLAMHEALDAYLAQGGRLMYLGGNGFYWVTSIDRQRPHVIEVRRGATGTWTSPPGEIHHSTTGEPGDLWSTRGRSPHRLVGSSYTAYGLGSLPYRRCEGSFDPRAAFIFAGIADDAVIGSSGAVMGGAAGHEVDRMDVALGTPRHALLLATAYDPANLLGWASAMEEEGRPKRGDIVYFECPQGGAVFSAGSIAWIGSLATDGGVSRITANVLSRFCGDDQSDDSAPAAAAPSRPAADPSK